MQMLRAIAPGFGCKVGRLAHLADHAARDAGGAHHLFPVRCVAAAQLARQLALHRGTIGAAQIGIGEAWVGKPILALEQFGQDDELMLLDHAQRDPAPVARR